MVVYIVVPVFDHSGRFSLACRVFARAAAVRYLVSLVGRPAAFRAAVFFLVLLPLFDPVTEVSLWFSFSYCLDVEAVPGVSSC